ncbi:hypothetical protein DICSQDRAFT_133871 [Dichomitus squalens LYAD-421 SS1]|uniref:Secreted protein n=1 Tax=Dichomitus squalens TaxID=114155 RepID=A0A4Q9MST5_9APHY|nr:uncharacterized protein DICSQDRAFT_133871 [Dichomitus squalens LYAD-421 SS1]EJF64210.1 hypothetical protein DICSQDRAFT_133871 [Dichomitus squalens LYAD-421 SS1]TBU30695.1 hypothetical protein BD311DRAFT_186706 [Dichomitus squalens]
MRRVGLTYRGYSSAVSELIISLVLQFVCASSAGQSGFAEPACRATVILVSCAQQRTASLRLTLWSRIHLGLPLRCTQDGSGSDSCVSATTLCGSFVTHFLMQR